MGTEFHLADCRDVVDLQLGAVVDGGGQAADPHCFPYAVGVPGCQHLLDTSLTHAIGPLTFWPKWEKEAKAVSQWLAVKIRRDFLAHECRKDPTLAHAHPNFAKTLAKGCDRFAKWRWQTLAKVTADLARLGPLVRAVLGRMNSWVDLQSRNGREAKEFFEAATSDSLWAQADALADLVEPMTDMSSWLRGCHCHDAELRQRRSIDCDWKGVRGPWLYDRLQELYGSIDKVRVNAVRHGPIAEEVSMACTSLLSTLQVKFNWVDELPYLVWRLQSPAMANRFVQDYDAQVAAGVQPHRVSTYLADESEGNLGGDLRRFAADGIMSQALEVEVRAYGMCMLDDTWPESLHKDVSCVAKRVNLFSVAGRAAQWRCEQCLQQYEEADAPTRRYTQQAYKAYKHVLRPMDFGDGRLRSMRGAMARHLFQAKVYRARG